MSQYKLTAINKGTIIVSLIACLLYDLKLTLAFLAGVCLALR